MADQPGSRSAEVARAHRIKRRNAITALLSGSILAAVVLELVHFDSRELDPLRLVAGFLAGVLYANGFEYVLHRFFLHWGEGFLVQRHGLHHDTAGAAEEPRYVNFATSPWVVVLVFVLNALPVFAMEFFLHTGLAPRNLSPASRFISLPTKRFTGAFILGDGCRDGFARREATICCITAASRVAITSSCRFSTGSSTEAPGGTARCTSRTRSESR